MITAEHVRQTLQSSSSTRTTRVFLAAIATLVTLALVCMVSPRPAAAGTNGTVCGTVTDSQTGLPLSWAVVESGHYTDGTFTWDNGTNTNEAGSYTLSLTPGEHVIHLGHFGYVPEWFDGHSTRQTATAVLVNSDQTTIADADLTPAEYGTIKGRATDVDTGEPLTGTSARIYQYQPDLERWEVLTIAYTSVTEPYEYQVMVPAGQYRVLFTNWAYEVAWHDGKVTEATADVVTVGAGQTVDASTALKIRPGRVRGHVRDSHWGGVANITVTALSVSDGAVVATTTTDDNGYYQTVCNASLTSMPLKLRYSDPNGDWEQVYYKSATDLASAQVLDVAAPFELALDEVVMTASSPARISGTIRNTAGDPLPDIAVTAQDEMWPYPSWSTTTDDAGAYVFGDLPSGGHVTYIVGCDDANGNYQPAWYDAKTNADDADAISGQPGADSVADIVLLRSASISGTVSGSSGPLADIVVKVQGWHGQVSTETTDAQGHYRIASLSNDQYFITFTDPTGEYIGATFKPEGTSTEWFTIGGDIIEYVADMSLDISCSVTGRLTTLEGDAIANATAIVYDLDGQIVAVGGTPNAADPYLLDDLPPGSYKLGFSAHNFAPEYFDDTPDWDKATVIELTEQARQFTADATLDPKTDPPVPGAYPDGSMFDSTILTGAGGALHVSGDTAVMSSSLRGVAAEVYVRTASGWRLQQRIPSPADRPVFDTPGISMAVDGDTLALGFYSSDGRGDKVGCAYVYARSAGRWTLQSRIAPSATDPAYLSFGERVALSGDSLLVGAPSVKVGTARWAGVAYAYQRSGTTWDKVGRLVAKDYDEDDFFACDIAIDGDRAVLGAYMDDTSAGVNHGSAYVFVRSGDSWRQEAKLNVDDEDRGPQIGSAVAISGATVALAGERAVDERGAVYVFVRSDGGWKQQARLVAKDGVLGDYAGGNLALSDDRILVTSRSSYCTTVNSRCTGVVYLYERSGSTWRQLMRFAPESTERYKGYGGTVAVAGPELLITAPSEGVNSNGYPTGLVHVFSPYITDPGKPLSVDAAYGVLVNDMNGEAPGTLVATLLAGPAHGQLQLGVDGSFTYTPAQGFVGVDTFSYAASCGAWHSAAATVSVNVRDAKAPSIAPQDLPTGWVNTPLTVTLAAPASASDIASIDYKKITGDRWLRYLKPFTVNSEGASTYATRARDVFGNVNTAGRFAVKLDTHKPTPRAPYAASGTHNGKMTIRYKVVDPRPGSPTANVTIIVKNAQGNSVGDVFLKGKTVNKLLSSTVDCWLRRGTYTFFVAATDRAGNQQTKLASNKLVIK